MHVSSSFRATPLLDSSGSMVVTNDLGEYAILSPKVYDALVKNDFEKDHSQFLDLVAKGIVPREHRGGVGLEETVKRTRKAWLFEGPSLHIFVVTLRCDHACAYCQVSRADIGASGFDMSLEFIDAAIERVFESPAKSLTIEFQGGEPSLRFDLIRYIVNRVAERNCSEKKEIHFSLISTLHRFTDEDVLFCKENNIHISTSIDGAAHLHNAYRRSPTADSWQKTIDQIKHIRSIIGHDSIAALPTLTKAALKNPKELIDTYVSLGFSSVFLRPMSPYGFAAKTRKTIGYPISDFVNFYEQSLDYLLELNRTGTHISETYTSILLRHIFTPFGSNYLDLRSPAGAGLGVLVYNYDGKVYPSDEARMVAETGDKRFVLGSVFDSLDHLLSSEAMRWLAQGSIAENLSGCSECAFVPFCGADPVYHAAIQGNPEGNRENSEFCQKHMGLFRVLFRHIARADPETMRTFLSWAFDCARDDIIEPGFIEA